MVSLSKLEGSTISTRNTKSNGSILSTNSMARTPTLSSNANSGRTLLLNSRRHRLRSSSDLPRRDHFHQLDAFQKGLGASTTSSQSHHDEETWHQLHAYWSSQRQLPQLVLLRSYGAFHKPRDLSVVSVRVERPDSIGVRGGQTLLGDGQPQCSPFEVSQASPRRVLHNAMDAFVLVRVQLD